MRRAQLLAGFVCGLAVLALVGVAVQADDTIQSRKGGFKRGTISRMTANEIVLDAGGEQTKFDANAIDWVKFDGEPAKLALIRGQIKNGQYEASLEQLKELEAEASGLSNFIKQDIAFYKAWCEGQLALKGSADLKSAGTNMLAWVNANPNSYHYYEGAELLGDLILAFSASNADAAIAQYGKLSAAPWADTKARGEIAKGRAQLVAKRASEALATFNGAETLLDASSGPEADQLKLAATLGKAQAMAETGKVPEAEGLVLDVIKKADPEQAELHARAYNTLGSCYMANKDYKKAMVQYMHTHLLYSRNPQLHAEALAQLAACFTALGDTDNGLRFQNLSKTYKR